MNFERIHLNGRAYQVVEKNLSQTAAKRLCQKHRETHPAKHTQYPGMKWIVIRPIHPQTRLPEEYQDARKESEHA